MTVYGTLPWPLAPECICIAPSGKSQWSDEGMRVKKFNVFEPRYFRGELLNFTEYRQSGTPGGFPGAVFLVLFYAKKVQRGFWKLRNWIPAFAGMTEHARCGIPYINELYYAEKVLQNYSVC
jgi:hypothetical protein